MRVKEKSNEQIIGDPAELRPQEAPRGQMWEQLPCDIAACQEALAKYESIVRAFHGIVYVCSSNYEIEFVNERGAVRTGRDPIGEKCYQVVHGLEAVCPWCVADRVSRGETVSQEVLSPKDNRWYHSVHTSLSHPGDRFAKMAMLYDITERKQAEADRDRLIAELRSKNADLEIFSHAVSHDLRAPLVTIRGLLKWIERDALGGSIDRLRVNLSLVNNAAARMEHLVTDILEFSQIGHFCTPLEEVSLGELASEAAQLVSGSIAEKGVKVTIHPNLPTVRGDRSRLLQVFQNLLENAVKFMGAQSNPKIEVGARVDGNETVLYVSDNGTGIEPADKDRVFNPFVKVEDSARGTGLGLALVKRIVEIHGGRIWVESQGRDKGSTFCFTLGRTDALAPKSTDG